MAEKISTSIQYQFSNSTLFYEIFGNWLNFNEHLNKGPETMKKFLLDKWNETKDRIKDNENLIIKDLDKIITEDDFNITFNKTKKGTFVYFFTFPDYEYRDAASKYLALALTPKMPRYFTLEYSESFLTKEPCFVIGEFYLEDNKRLHKNYGEIDNSRLSYFAGYILGILDALENRGDKDLEV